MGASISTSSRNGGNPVTANSQESNAKSLIAGADVVIEWSATRPGRSALKGVLLGFKKAEDAELVTQYFIATAGPIGGGYHAPIALDPYDAHVNGRRVYFPQARTIADSTPQFLGCYDKDSRDLIKVPPAPVIAWPAEHRTAQVIKSRPNSSFGKGL